MMSSPLIRLAAVSWIIGPNRAMHPPCSIGASVVPTYLPPPIAFVGAARWRYAFAPTSREPVLPLAAVEVVHNWRTQPRGGSDISARTGDAVDGIKRRLGGCIRLSQKRGGGNRACRSGSLLQQLSTAQILETRHLDQPSTHTFAYDNESGATRSSTPPFTINCRRLHLLRVGSIVCCA